MQLTSRGRAVSASGGEVVHWMDRHGEHPDDGVIVARAAEDHEGVKQERTGVTSLCIAKRATYR